MLLTNRQTNKQTNKQTDKQTNRPTDKQTIMVTNKVTKVARLDDQNNTSPTVAKTIG